MIPALFPLTVFAALLLSIPVFAREAELPPVMISETMTGDNTVLADETGAFPDWVELYNSGETGINLTGYGLSDDETEPFRWVFPEVVIPPKGYLVVFASGRDTTATGMFAREVVSRGDIWKYRVFTTEPPSDWNAAGFDDSGWASGPSGFGFGDGDDATLIPESSVSVHVRREFTIADAGAVTAAVLRMDFDDGFFAWLNGVEIARAGIGAKGFPPRFDAYATLHTEANLYQNKPPLPYTINDIRSIVRDGVNVLAIQGHNSENSADMSLIPLLDLTEEKAAIHTGFKISAGETLILTDPAGNGIDRAVTVETLPGNSQGKAFGDTAWVCFSRPTPGKDNDPAGFSGLTEAPVVSPPGGFHAAGIALSLASSTSGAVVYYTTDGTEPTEQSSRYLEPLVLDRTTVVRSRAFAAGYLPSAVVTHTYLVNETITLPVVSLSTDPKNLWGSTGIYTNFLSGWERPVHIEFFEPGGEPGFSMDAGLKIHGASSASFDQKSFQVFARSAYGQGEIEHRVFPDLSFDTFEALVLRNSGHDWGLTMFRDALISSLAQGTEVDVQAYRPSIVFINGQYWGLHNIREKVNEHFLASHHKVDPDSIDMMEYVVQHNVVSGDRVHFDAMIRYMETHDLSVPEYYAQAGKLLDIDQFIDYQAIEIFSDNGDWPGNNVKFWRPRTPDGKWRWIMYDTDCGFGHPIGPSTPDHNKLLLATHPDKDGWGNYGPWSTFIIRNLLKNREFQHRFINRFADLMNSRFYPDSLLVRIDTMQNGIRPEMSRHFGKWGGSVTAWEGRVNVLRDFARRRNVFMRDHLLSYFSLDRNVQFTFGASPEGAGTIEVNTLSISRFPWRGYYFSGVPIRVTARPAPGYRFAGWEESAVPDSASLVIDPDQGLVLTARFEPIPPSAYPVVITEINYHSGPDLDSGDWLELFNPGPSPVDISGWKLSEEGESEQFILPSETVLGSSGYLVLCRDSQAFARAFPDVPNAVGNLPSGLDNGGGILLLLDAAGTVVDSVPYDDGMPWPTEPDGGGATLSLRAPGLDNALPESWASSRGYGTPGEPNVLMTAVDDRAGDAPAAFTVEQNRPNPFNPDTSIRFGIPSEAMVTVEVFNVLGQKVATPFRGRLNGGFHTVLFRAGGLTSGIYFYRVQAGESRMVRRMTLVR